MKKTLLLTALLALTNGAHAEMAFSGNPAQIHDNDALRLNPALAAWQPLTFQADWQALHLGLADSPAAFGQGGFAFTLPRWNLAMQGRMRDTDLLQEVEASLQWAWQPLTGFSVGIEGGMYRFGWNSSVIHGDLGADPVFRDGSSRVQPVVGVGCFYAPLPGLHMALALRHLNRPSLSLNGSDTRAPIRSYAGVEWRGREVAFGLAVDNLDYIEADGSAGSALAAELSPSLYLDGHLLPELEAGVRYRHEALGFSCAYTFEKMHRVSYEYLLPLGDLAEQSTGSHRISYSVSLGDWLLPSGVQSRPVTQNMLAGLFGRRTKAYETPLLMGLRDNSLELVELHLHLPDSLAAQIPLESLLAAQLDRGQAITPEGGELVRGTYSAEYFRLAGLLEELQQTRGVIPVIHAGENTVRIEDVAVLAGTTVDARVGGLHQLPQSGALVPVPDSLQLEISLPESFAEACAMWEATMSNGAGFSSRTSGRGTPPASLKLGVRDTSGALPGLGAVLVELKLYDDDRHLLASRQIEAQVMKRVRHAWLRAMDPGEPAPEGTDGIHILLGE